MTIVADEPKKRREIKSKNKNPQPTLENDNAPNYIDLFGRPTKYRPEMDRQCTQLAMLGYTQKEMAGFFEIAESTFSRWLASYPSLRAAIREGGEDADMLVVAAMHKTAIGYSVETEELKVVNVARDKQEVVRHKVSKHYPGDFRAQSRWLGNRRRSTWAVDAEPAQDADTAQSAQAAIAAADAINEGES